MTHQNASPTLILVHDREKLAKAVQSPVQNELEMTPDQFKSDMIALLPQLRRFALSLTRSGPDADDLLQDACTAALSKWQQYDPTQPLDRWLFRVMRNLWISEIRKRKTRLGEGQVPAEDAPELSATDSTEHHIDLQKTKSHMDCLPAELSQPLLLVCAEGYSYREAAELLDVPIGTVMSRLHRARKTLIKRMTMTEEAAT